MSEPAGADPTRGSFPAPDVQAAATSATRTNHHTPLTAASRSAHGSAAQMWAKSHDAIPSSLTIGTHDPTMNAGPRSRAVDQQPKHVRKN